MSISARSILAAALIWLVLALPAFAQLGAQSGAQSGELSARVAADLDGVVATEVVDTHKFYGLAGYYNEAYWRVVDADSGLQTPEEGELVLEPGQWLAAVGRFEVLALQAPGLRVAVGEDGEASVLNPGALSAGGARVELVSKPDLAALAPELDRLRYSHLIAPIRWLCLLLDRVMVLLHGLIGSWGLAIIAIALLIKLALFPLGRLVKRYQTQVSRTQTALAPRLAEIKRTMKGEAAHKAFVAAHKEQGVSTFYTLKPMIGLLVQIPVWIAIFNVLAEMPQLQGEGFLWMRDLAYPDAILNWGAALPLLGDTLNLMPIVMTVVTVVSTLTFRDPDATPAALAKQKRNLFFMAAAFLILFYPFPSGMVFYWTLANLLNFGQQLLGRRKAA